MKTGDAIYIGYVSHDARRKNVSCHPGGDEPASSSKIYEYVCYYIMCTMNPQNHEK